MDEGQGRSLRMPTGPYYMSSLTTINNIPSICAACSDHVIPGVETNDNRAIQLIDGFVLGNPYDSLTRLLSTSPQKLSTLADYFNYLYENDDDNVRYQAIRLAQILTTAAPDSAKMVLDWFLEGDPENMDAYRAYAAIYEAQGNSYGYADFIRERIAQHPDLTELNLILITHYLDQGDRSQALATIKDIRSVSPFSEYYDYLANYVDNALDPVFGAE